MRKEAECIWFPKPYHQGWLSIMNGGIIATIIDCHCMGTAMAYAYKKENRSLEFISRIQICYRNDNSEIYCSYSK